MNTRWHEEDVAGRVLEQIERKEIKGRVISIAAIAEANDPLGREPGEYLWDDPDGYDYGAFLRARQRETSPMMWSAVYQQRPAPEEGDFFRGLAKALREDSTERDHAHLWRLRLCRYGGWRRLHSASSRRYRS
jgi:hypothetical protein